MLKYSRFSLFIFLTCLVLFARPIEDLICPDSNPKSCYPRLFEASSDWRVVEEGQEIPGGLHIRVNMETGAKEAKILDKLDLPENQQLEVLDSHATLLEQEQDKKLIAHKPNSKLTLQDKNEFGEAVNLLTTFLSSPKEVTLDGVFQALSSLEELSHDIDFGIKISSEVEIFTALLELSNILPSEHLKTSQLSLQELETVKENLLTIIGSTLRNNPVAVQNLLSPDLKPSYIINKILDNLAGTSNKVIQKRLLGVISGFIQDPQGVRIFNLNDGKNKILIVFGKLSSDSQLRALQILDELSGNRILKRSEDGSEQELSKDDIDSQYFQLLKNTITNDSNHPDFKKLFIQLVNLKQTSKADLKVDSEFLNWLIDEIERRKNDHILLKRDNEDTEHGVEGSFSDYMMKMRHLTFGNPMGYRKAFIPEDDL